MAAAIEGWLNQLYRDLDSSSAQVEKQFEERIPEGSKISRNDISGLRGISTEFLDSHRLPSAPALSSRLPPLRMPKGFWNGGSGMMPEE